MLFQLLIFAVHGQEVLGLGQGEHQLLLLLTGVTGNVHIVHALVDDLCAQQQQTVDDLGHALFVAGDGVCRDDDEVAGAYTHLTVAAGGHTAQRAQGLALPVVTSTTCSGGYWFSSSTLIRVPSGMCI